MLRKDFILHKTRTLLSGFVSPIIAAADKPRQKFLRQTVAAILLSGCLVVKELTRWIHDDWSDLFYRLKRLLNNLVSPSGDLSGVVAGYRQSLAPYISADMPLVIDITDLAVPAMGFLTWVLLRSCRLAKALYGFTSRFRKAAKFVYYRLLEGLQQFARLRRLRLTKTSLQPL